GEPASVSPASPAVQRWFGLGWGDDEDGEADASTHAAGPVEKKPQYLASYLSGRQFPWDLLQPDAKLKKALTAKIIQDWIDFYGLSVYGMPAPDRTKDCTFNGGMTDVNGVVSLFMKEARLAGFRDDPYGAYEIISRDQAAKYQANEEHWNKHHGKGGGGGGGLPHKPSGSPGTGHDAKGHDNHVALEWEFTPLTAKKTWGGEDEVEGPKHQLKGVLHAKVWEIGASWKAEVSGSAVVELEHGKPAKVGAEVEGKLSREFIAELLELELVAKVLAANEARLKHGEAVNGRMQSPPVHVTPGVDVNVVYTIPGTKGLLQVKGGVSADPEGISLGAAFSVSWK
ncbi:MAG: hypothetical protein K8M05_19300, partial [Deltaproteobacteria bacterium]|nr:hypothetical protein [Kofleriaceae bacterium]